MNVPNTSFGSTTLLAILVGIKSGELTFGEGTDADGNLTILPTKRAQKRAARAEKNSRFDDIKALVQAELELRRPLKIGPILAAVKEKLGLDAKVDVKVRLETSQALRDLRTAGILQDSNSTNSNFHTEWTLTAKPEAYPVPEPVVVPEPVAPAADTAPTEGAAPKAPKAKKEPKAKKGTPAPSAPVVTAEEAPAAEPTEAPAEELAAK